MFFKRQTTKDAQRVQAAATPQYGLIMEPPMQTDTAVLERQPKHLTPRVDRDTMPEDAMAEYRAVAREIGVSDADLMVEEFRAFLAAKDIPTFALAEVVAYMDKIAEADNPSRLGWHWCPVRPKDATVPLTFGRPSKREHRETGHFHTETSSDFYESHRFRDWHGEANGGGMGGWVTISGASLASGSMTVNSASEAALAAMQAAHDLPRAAPRRPHWRDMVCPAYTRTLPLHAMKKIALIEREFGAGKAVFLVSDYTTQPHIVVNPDPFLMAVIPNSAVAHGKGRFVIDVWDEPGFGIDRMVR